MQIVGSSNNLIHIQYVVDIEFIYQISILPVSKDYYLIIDSFLPEYAKAVSSDGHWKMTQFCMCISDALAETAEYDLSYPYTLQRIGTFYEDNYDHMLFLIENA